MKRTVGNQTIELLDLNPSYDQLPTQQAETYQLLLAIGEGPHSEQAMVEQLGLKSALPWRSRLEHLQERGLIRVLAATVAS